MAMINELFNLEDVYSLHQPETFIYLLVTLSVLYIGKKVYDWSVPYDLNEQLTVIDNKAAAVSFAGYMFGLGIIMRGVLSTDTDAHFWKDISDTITWGFIGILLLQASRIINDKVIFYKFLNIKEIIEDKNIGTGAVQCGSFIGSAFIVMAAVSGEDASFIKGSISTLIFFVLGQFAFILFSRLFQAITRFDLHAEIEKDNVSAGVGFGMTMAAMGLLLSNSIVKSDSIIAFAIWFILSAMLLVMLRYLVDKLILPGQLLDEEISKDQNWGAALINGSIAIIIALLVNTAY